MDLSQLLPFASAQPSTVPQPVADAEGANDGLVGRWRSFLSDPGNRAAVMQFGVSLTQPPSFADNSLSQIGRAVGDAGEASTRVTEAEQKQQELASKQDLRTSQAQLAEARAGTAGSNAALQASKIDLARERLATQQGLGSLQRKIQASNAYNAYAKGVQDRNAKAKTNADLFGTTATPEPLLTPQDYYARHGFGDILGGEAAAPSVGTEPGGGSPPTQYPDAKQAPDGNWYVQRNGKYFKVTQ